jgi:hypothetical protein
MSRETKEFPRLRTGKGRARILDARARDIPDRLAGLAQGTANGRQHLPAVSVFPWAGFDQW